MAKEVDTGMDKGEMKKLLMLARKGPVNAAFAQGPDAKFALLTMDKVKQGRPLSQELSKKFSDSRNPRFGTVTVDPEVDAKLAVFQVDKPVSSMAKRLVKTLKGTGITKVEIRLDDGSLVEADGEEDETETGTGETEETVQTQPSQGVPPPPPPPQPQQPQYDAGQLAQLLTEQVKRIPGVLAITPALRDSLMKFATDAQVNIKTGNLTYAANSIDQLRLALDNAPTAPQGGTAPQPPQQQQEGGKAATYTKSGQAWLATRRKMEEDIEKLRAAIVAAYEADGIGPKLDTAYSGLVKPVLDTLDTSLTDTLAEATKATDPNQQSKLVGDAKSILERYQQFVSNDATIGNLDANPFMPLQLAKVLGGTLATLSKTVN